MDRPIDRDSLCFCCGLDNDRGLHLAITYPEKGTAETSLEVPAWFTGWKNMTHGGLLATLLDEIMAHACVGMARRAVTAEMTVRYQKAVETGSASAHGEWWRRRADGCFRRAAGSTMRRDQSLRRRRRASLQQPVPRKQYPEDGYPGIQSLYTRIVNLARKSACTRTSRLLLLHSITCLIKNNYLIPTPLRRWHGLCNNSFGR